MISEMVMRRIRTVGSRTVGRIGRPRFRGRAVRRGGIILALALGLQGCGRERQPDDLDDIVRQAREHLLVFQFDRARHLLQGAEHRFPDDHPAKPELLFVQALTLWHAVPPSPGDIQRAARLLDTLAERFPHHERAPAALLFLGRLRDIRNYAGDEPDVEGARAAYRAFLERFPDHDLAPDAMLRLSMTYLKQFDQPEAVRQGVDLLRAWHEAHPDSRHAPVMALFLGTLHDQQLGDRAEALRYYRQAIDLGLVNPGRAGVNVWRLAELALETGMLAAGYALPREGFLSWDVSRVGEDYLRIAIEACRTVILRHPRSGRGHEAVLLLQAIRQARPDLDIDIPPLQLFEVQADPTPP